MKHLTIRRLPPFVHVLLAAILLFNLLVVVGPLIRRFGTIPTVSPTTAVPANEEFNALLRELEGSKNTIRSLLQ